MPLARGPGQQPRPRRRGRDRTRPDLALLQYTGGTTGLSKGVMLTHENLNANAAQINAWLPDLEPGREVILAVLPFFHSYGLTTCLTSACASAPRSCSAPLRAEARVRGDRQVPPDRLPRRADDVRRHQQLPGRLQARPVQHQGLRLRCGAALLEVSEEFERLSGGRLVEGYGLTEASPVTHANPVYGKRKVGTIGMPLPNTIARVADPEDISTTMPVGDRGELAVKGPQVMKGYWNRPEETAQVLQDGWLLTGDMATMDEEGYFAIVDRKKDLVIAGRVQRLPARSRRGPARDPAVMEVCVAGVPHEYMGEVVKAYIVLRPGAEATVEEVRDFVKERLAAYKVPREIEFRDELPKTMIGKVLRRKLIEEEQAKVAQQTAGADKHGHRRRRDPDRLPARQGPPGPGHRQLRLVRLQPRPVPGRAGRRDDRVAQRRWHRRRRRSLAIDAILVSPGPGHPADARLSVDVVRDLGGDLPILGVCLGHQVIGHVHGGTIARAPELLHGKTSPILHEGAGVLTGLPDEFRATRYHSLVVEEGSVPPVLEVTGRTAGGLVMALRHRELPVEGVQFHPESVLTDAGHRLLANWLDQVRTFKATRTDATVDANPKRSSGSSSSPIGGTGRLSCLGRFVVVGSVIGGAVIGRVVVWSPALGPDDRDRLTGLDALPGAKFLVTDPACAHVVAEHPFVGGLDLEHLCRSWPANVFRAGWPSTLPGPDETNRVTVSPPGRQPAAMFGAPAMPRPRRSTPRSVTFGFAVVRRLDRPSLGCARPTLGSTPRRRRHSFGYPSQRVRRRTAEQGDGQEHQAPSRPRGARSHLDAGAASATRGGRAARRPTIIGPDRPRCLAPAGPGRRPWRPWRRRAPGSPSRPGRCVHAAGRRASRRRSGSGWPGSWPSP